MARTISITFVFVVFVSLLAVPVSADIRADTQHDLDLCIDLPLGIDIGCDDENDRDDHEDEDTETPTQTPPDGITITPDQPTQTPTETPIAATSTPITDIETPTQTVTDALVDQSIPPSTETNTVTPTDTETPTDHVTQTETKTETPVPTESPIEPAQPTETSVQPRTPSSPTPVSVPTPTPIPTVTVSTLDDRSSRTTPSRVTATAGTNDSTTTVPPTTSIEETIPQESGRPTTPTTTERPTEAVQTTRARTNTPRSTTDTTTPANTPVNGDDSESGERRDTRAADGQQDDNDRSSGWIPFGYWSGSSIMVAAIGMLGYIHIERIRRQSLIDWLIEQFGRWGWLIIGQHRDDDPLALEPRRTILETMREHPEYTLRKVAEATDLSRLTVRKHAAILAEEELLIEMTRYEQRRFITTTENDEPRSRPERAYLHTHKSDAKARVLNAIHEYDGRPTQADLVENLNLSRSTISEYIDEFETECFLSCSCVGGKRYLALTESIENIHINIFEQ